MLIKFVQVTNLMISMLPVKRVRDRQFESSDQRLPVEVCQMDIMSWLCDRQVDDRPQDSREKKLARKQGSQTSNQLGPWVRYSSFGSLNSTPGAIPCCLTTAALDPRRTSPSHRLSWDGSVLSLSIVTRDGYWKRQFLFAWVCCALLPRHEASSFPGVPRSFPVL